MMRTSRLPLAVVVSFALLASFEPVAAATPRVGSACAIAGKKVVVGQARLQCAKNGSRLVWKRVLPKVRGGSLRGDITVYAAASLTEAFTNIARQFQKANPLVHVTFSFAGSSSLATQLINGAPADVFASASVSNMQQVVDAKVAYTPSTFARNRMIIVTPPGNPARITSLRELAKSNVKVAVCQMQVPCGTAATKVFANAGITVTPVTLEADVKSVLTKVLLGEVDAGLVYMTDARSAGDKVQSIDIDSSLNVDTTYPIAVLSSSSHPAVARAFVNFVLGAQGSAALASVGFTVI